MVCHPPTFHTETPLHSTSHIHAHTPLPHLVTVAPQEKCNQECQRQCLIEPIHPINNHTQINYDTLGGINVIQYIGFHISEQTKRYKNWKP
jgi:hypothetical protein